MAPNKYVQFLNEHRIDDGLLREFLHKEKFKAARLQVEQLIANERIKIEKMYQLKDILERMEVE